MALGFRLIELSTELKASSKVKFMDIQNRNSNTTGESMPIPSIGFMVIFGVFVLVAGIGVALLARNGVLPVLPVQASEQAKRTDDLFYVLLGIGSMVFFLIQGLLLYSVVRFRAKPNDVSDGPNFHGNALLEIVWTIIPTVVVIVLAVLSVVVWNTNNAVSENENLVDGQKITINATGQRYAWSFEYLTNETNINSEPIVINSKELHTYVGQDVKVDLNPVDVIHSFWVPAMRIKQDVIPGRLTSIRFKPANDSNYYEYTQVTGPLYLVSEPGVDIPLPTPEPETPIAEATAEATTAPEATAEATAAPEATAEATPEAMTEPAAEEPQDERIVFFVEDGDNIETQILGYDESGAWVNVTLHINDEVKRTGWIPTDALGTFYNKYRIVCAELCGGGHGEMFAWIHIHDSEEAFMGWYNQEVQKRFEPPKDPVILGQQILESGKYPCANCHVLDSLGWAGITGPALNGIADRAGSRVSGLNAVEYLLATIHEPNAYLVPGYAAGQMPHFGYDETAPAGQIPYNQMSEADLIGIIGYLCTQTASGNPQDNTCGLQFGDDGALVDVDSANIFIKAFADVYDDKYEANE